MANFADAIGKPGFLHDLGNSVLVTGAVVVVAIVVAFLAATALTRFRFPGRRGFLIAVLVVQMVPVPALVIPLFLSLKSVHLLDTFSGWASPTWRWCCRSPSGPCAGSCRASRWSWRRRQWSTAPVAAP
ncbi:hypothetical protein [Kutzneria kofuensis]|uniref:hypothetical protein n=1 Tax=Kutzneria kofuensis TaxID=103725 RepID=UPI0031E60E44